MRERRPASVSVKWIDAQTRQIAYDRRHDAPSATKVLADLWRAAGQPDAALEAVTLTGAEPALPSSFASAPRRRRPSPRRPSPPTNCGICAPAGVSASASTCATPGSSSAASATCASTASRRTSIATRPSALYRTGDGRWIRLHTNLPHHRAGTLKLLGAEYDRASVQRAIDGWDAFDLEDAAQRRASSSPRPARSPNGTPSARRGGGAPAAVLHRPDRRRAAAAAARRATAAGRRQGAGPDPRDRRAGVRTHARRARRRRAEHLAPRICRRWKRW